MLCCAVQYHLYQLETVYDSSNIYYRNQNLCESVGGNNVPLLTITSHPITYDSDGVEQLSMFNVHWFIVQLTISVLHCSSSHDFLSVYTVIYIE